MMVSATISIVLMLLCGVALGLIIGYAAKIFQVKTDSRIETVTEMLPGANCGACGRAGCADLARAIVEGKASPALCTACSSRMIKKIADFMGISVGDIERKVAVVLCGGGLSKTKTEVNYNGIRDCVSASLVAGGPKDCQYGCLGFASCARACPFNAIEMSDGLAVVHNDVCTGCGMCVETCPRKLIILVPAKAGAHIYCNSPEKGAVKKNFCSAACIACRKCVKSAAEGQISMEGFLARVNYSNPPDASVIEKASCPTGCLKAPPAPAGNEPEEDEE